MSSIKGCLLSKVIFNQRSSSIKTRLQSKVIIKSCFPLSSIYGNLPSKVVSVKGCLPSKVFFHQRLSSIKVPLPSKVVFNQRLTSIEGILPTSYSNPVVSFILVDFVSVPLVLVGFLVFPPSYVWV